MINLPLKDLLRYWQVFKSKTSLKEPVCLRNFFNSQHYYGSEPQTIFSILSSTNIIIIEEKIYLIDLSCYKAA